MGEGKLWGKIYSTIIWVMGWQRSDTNLFSDVTNVGASCELVEMMWLILKRCGLNELRLYEHRQACSKINESLVYYYI